MCARGTLVIATSWYLRINIGHTIDTTHMVVVRLALPMAHWTSTTPASLPKVHRVAVCVGSGSSVFKAWLTADPLQAYHRTTTAALRPAAAAPTTPVADASGSVGMDVLLTGEMSHHDALEAVGCSGRPTAVVLVEHTNSERGYLRAVLAPRLTLAFQTDPAMAATRVLCSDVDQDPLVIV